MSSLGKVFIWICIDQLFMHCVLCQYTTNNEYNQMHNQFDRDETSDNYMRQVKDYNQLNNQKQSRSYPSDNREVPMPYEFGYNVNDEYGNKQDRQEKGDEFGNIKGSYGYMDSNGIYRRVEYTAGPEIGFVAKINTNEPSIKANPNPADVMFIVEEPPLHLREPQMRQQSNDNQYKYNVMNDQMKGQIINMFDNEERQLDKRYDAIDNNYGRMKPFLQLINPNRERNENEDNHYYSDSIQNNDHNYSNQNMNDMQTYATNPRRLRRRFYY